jgi:hypothetical protein
MRRKPADVREVAAAIVQRADQGHVLTLSDPPTLEQRLHLMAAQIDRQPIVIISVNRFAAEGNERDGQPNAG